MARLSVYCLIFLGLTSIISVHSCKHDPVYPPGWVPPLDTSGLGRCDPESVYFANDIQPILARSCANSTACHAGTRPAEGISLTNYAGVMQGNQVRPGRPDNSEIFEVITETDPDKIMPPPPYSPLSASERDFIRRWIEQGAPNNACNPNLP
jgi:hypothetical protein